MLLAFRKPGQQHTILKGMAWLNALNGHFSNFLERMWMMRLTGRDIYPLHYWHIAFIHWCISIHAHVWKTTKAAPIVSSTKSQAFDPASYKAQITCKMANLWKHNLFTQQPNSEALMKSTRRIVNLLLVTLSGYLFLQHENLTLCGIGGWKVTKILNPTNVQICNGKQNRVVHINRLLHRF